MNRRDLQPLLGRPVRNSNTILSVYLNVDPPPVGLNPALK